MVKTNDRGLLRKGKTIAKFSKFNGYITIFDFISSMRAEEKCDEPIGQLLDLLDLPGITKGYGFPGIEWYEIWMVFAGGPQPNGNKDHPFSGLRPNMGESITPIKQYEKSDDILVPATILGGLGNYVKIDDVRQYFLKIENVFGIHIPLPERIFDDEKLPNSEEETGRLAQEESDINQHLTVPKRWPNIVSPVGTGTDIGWQGVTITFMGDEEILIQYGEEHTERRFNQAGFEDGRNGRPVSSWVVFSEAAKTGEIPFNTENRDKVEKIAQILNKKLSALFPNLPKTPIKLKTEKDGYRFAFHIAAIN